MRGIQPTTLLFILLGAVPVVVGGSGLASFLLLRAGYGILVWGVVPLFVSLFLVGMISALLGVAASGSRRRRGSNRDDERGV